MMARGGRGLAGLHAGTRERHHGHAAHVERGLVVEPLVAGSRRHADALAEIREGEHGAEHLAIERLALVRRRGIADAEHAADVQHLNHVPRLQRLGNVARIAEQRLAVAEGADHDVAARDLRHASAGELEGVVGRFVVEHLDHHHHALLAGNVGRDPDLVRKTERLRDRGDLVDHDRAHGAHEAAPFAPAAPRRRRRPPRRADGKSPAAPASSRSRAHRPASTRPRPRHTRPSRRP